MCNTIYTMHVYSVYNKKCLYNIILVLVLFKLEYSIEYPLVL